MKNLFSAIVNSSLFGYIKHLVILFVFFVVPFSVSANAWSGKATMKVRVTETGGGTVYVSTGQTATEGQPEKTVDVDEKNAPSATFYLFAKPESDDYSFAGWFEDYEGKTPATLSGTGAPTGQGDIHVLTGTSSVNNPSATFYAKFKAVWDFEIKFKAASGGTYTAIHKTDVEHSHTISTEDWTANDINSKTALNFTLKADPSTNNEFLRWVITNTENGTATYNYTNPSAGFQHTFTSSSEVSVEFIPKGVAVFCLKGNESALYVKLSEAIKAAVKESSKVIVVHRSGKLYPETESSTYFDVEANKYTIPEGITLLVPGDENYTVQMKELGNSDFISLGTDNVEFHEFKKLSVIDGQDFDVLGNICVYAKVHCDFAAMGLPYKYGWIELGENSHITLNSGANLSALGYITGNPENSSVTALAGSSVRELLQVADWRGGEAVNDAISSTNGKYKIFPFSQYYLQNIETKLILKAGAVEHISCGADVTLVGTVPINSTFVMPKDNPNYESGLFKLGEGAQLIKYYDLKKDRLNYEIALEQGYTSADVSFGNVKINMKLAITSGNINLESSAYVMPINNNMDFSVGKGITLEIPSDFALLAGSTLKVAQGAEVFTSKGASVFVYDAKEHHVKNDADKGSAISIKKGYYYNYFSSINDFLRPVLNRPGGVQYQRRSDDVEKATGVSNDDATAVTTMWMKSDAVITINGIFKGALYTTENGAKITSDGGGIIDFNSELVEDKKLYQFVQYADNGLLGNSDKVYNNQIPLSTSPLLFNADESFSSGGSITDEKMRKYTYYKDAVNPKSDKKGRWLHEVPAGSILADDVEGAKWNFTLPEVKTGELKFKPLTENLEINSITSLEFKGGCFASQQSSTYSFNNGVVSIPIQITPSTVHGTTTSETLKITFECTNTVSGVSESKTLEIGLEATEDYLPSFKINEKDSETLSFTATIGKPSESQVIKINPTDDNVTDRQYNNGYVTWIPSALSESVSSPFEVVSGDYFSGVKVRYNPTTTAGEHSQQLTITARYSDGVETVKTVTLQGTPNLASNQLAFVAESQEIYPGDVIDPLFKIDQLFNSIGNGEEIVFTYNGEATNDIIEIVRYGDNYKLQVKSGVNIITPKTISIKATQVANDIINAGEATIKVTVIPSVQWNWSKLYFGNTYENPIVVKNTDVQWTLTYNNDCDAISASKFTGDATNGYQVAVGSGSEDGATFTFTQGSYSLTLSSAVYANPRQLDMCMRDANAKRTFEDISVDKINVKYDDGVLFATTEESGAAWTMEIIGVPDKMEFIPTGDGKRWTIMESDDGESWSTTYQESEIVLEEGKTHFAHKLDASTKQIRITCSMGAKQGKITDLCVYALDASVNANVEKVYMPIVKDENGDITQSQESVVLSYVSPSSDLWLSIVDGDGNVVSDIALSGDNLGGGKLPATGVNNDYRKETIVVSSTYATEGIVYLLVKDNSDAEKLRLPIRLYNYPQPLPMRSAEWRGDNAEKYSFYTDFARSRNVQYDAVTQKISFTSVGGEVPFITFVFRGGPSYIEFETQLEMTPAEWYAYWSLQVTDGITNRLVAENENAEVQPVITTVIRGDVTYYKVHVDIPYTTKSLSLRTQRVVSIENIVIDGEPDLDVVLGNHTIEHEATVNFMPGSVEQSAIVTAINLEQLKVVCNNSHFTVKCGTINITSTPTTLTATECPNALGNYMVGDIALNIEWDKVNTVEEGLLIFTDKNGQELATIRLLGTKDFILKGNSAETGLFTGFAEKIINHPFTNEQQKHKYARKVVNLSNAFDENGVALFDYLVVYGETVAEDRGTTITAPTTVKGSNARTPMYIYRKVQNSEGVYDRYQFVVDQANVNHGEKVALHLLVDAEGQPVIPHAKETDGTLYMDIAEGEQLRIYMTGFCPYASTGFDKTQEGVWLFRGKKNAKLDVYLEDCHIYSRNKTEDGHAYNGKNDPGADIFTDVDYACGSGGVLVFECNDEDEYGDDKAFQVTIHTRGDNLLKSNYGCFYQIFGMRAYQVSSPIQIRLTSDKFEKNSKTHLTFDDKWPIDVADMAKFKRTNGFLSLLKQANNAPSIDMGNGNTVVNFRGGRVELQNAENVSDKYKTTLAISYRSGIMATGGLEIQMAYGIGTDAATKGIVNFYDGTTTVIPMKVDAKDRKYYLMDEDDPSTDIDESEYTSCLRCPQNTFVYGGSICMLRACMSPTSQGGAPTDGVRPLGRFFYKEEHGYEYNTANKTKPANHDDASQWLVNPVKFPSDDYLFDGLTDYHTNTAGYTYGIESVTPNENGELILWIPDGFGGVNAEEDRYLTSWKACMPEISAVLTELGVTKIGGTVGGPTSVENIEDVENLLYCQLDDEVYDVISETTGDDENYVYQAPLKIPEGFQMPGIDIGLGDYLRLAPSYVGGQDEHQMENVEDYKINNKIYYISSATADVWQTFTAPFDVENIWVVETFDETVLEALEPTEDELDEGITKRSKILKTQATHNADFAAFFGVAMALGSEQSFEEIYEDYMDWAKKEDGHSGSKPYTKRGKYPLTPYIVDTLEDGTISGNWEDANFYINHNKGNWTIKNAKDGEFVPQWDYVEKQGNVLLKKGETYSLLFPYCVGCWENDEETGEILEREYWDYWTGKFIIFESTQASKDAPHIVRGSNYVGAEQPEKGEWVFPSAEVTSSSTEAIVTGNSTFAHMTTKRSDVFVYDSENYIEIETEDGITKTKIRETFLPLEGEEYILPTTAFLLANPPVDTYGRRALSISRMGKINYESSSNNDDDDDTPTGGHVPTIADGSDIFVMGTAAGINIAVSDPQYVGVFSATGQLIYSGWVETSVDVNLVTNGVYVVVGENESMKVIY